MRAILLSRKDFKRSAADEAAGRPPVDDARWREVATVHLTPYALLHLLRLTPHTLHNSPHASHLFTPYASHLAPRTLRATCHPPPATYPLLTGTRCATCTRLRRCCASGGRSNAAALGLWTHSRCRVAAESLRRVSLSYIAQYRAEKTDKVLPIPFFRTSNARRSSVSMSPLSLYGTLYRVVYHSISPHSKCTPSTDYPPRIEYRLQLRPCGRVGRRRRVTRT